MDPHNDALVVAATALLDTSDHRHLVQCVRLTRLMQISRDLARKEAAALPDVPDRPTALRLVLARLRHQGSLPMATVAEYYNMVYYERLAIVSEPYCPDTGAPRLALALYGIMAVLVVQRELALAMATLRSTLESRGVDPAVRNRLGLLYVLLGIMAAVDDASAVDLEGCVRECLAEAPVEDLWTVLHHVAARYSSDPATDRERLAAQVEVLDRAAFDQAAESPSTATIERAVGSLLTVRVVCGLLGLWDIDTATWTPTGETQLDEVAEKVHAEWSANRWYSKVFGYE